MRLKYEVQDSKRFDSEKETEYNGHRRSRVWQDIKVWMNGRKEICPKLSERVMLFKTEQKELMLLKKYMKKHSVSYDEAFDALDIAEERYGVYLEKIEQKEW